MRGPLLSLRSAAALVVGHTIGVGIFLTPAELIGALASPGLTLGLWTLVGALVLAGAFTFGELAARYPETGGVYVYLRETWGERASFLFGWQTLLIMDPGLTAALAAGAAQYVVLLVPGWTGAERWVALATIWLLVVANLGGARLGTRVMNTLTTLKLLALAGFAVAAFVAGAGRWQHLTPFLTRRADAAPLGEALALGLVSAFFSFGGFWEAARVAGEVDDPRRTLPRALGLGVAAVTLVYLVTTVAFLYLVPPEGAATAAGFATRAGQALLGPAGPAVLAAVVVVSVLASAVAFFLMAPRLYLAMSEDGVLPKAVAARHPRTGVPVQATLLLAVLASGYVLVATFQQIVAFFMASTLAFVALAASGLVRARRRTPPAPGRFRAPGYPVTPILFVILVGAVVLLVVLNRPVQALAGFAVLLIGLPLYRLRRPSPPIPPTP